MTLFAECALFVVGLAFGSFLNVCISRIPRDESVVRPPSHCRQCGSPIRWWHNIPVLGWLLLRGRCADCGERISLRYPGVELLTGLLFVACYADFGPTVVTFKMCLFCFLLVGLIFMDAETGLLVREFTYPGIALGLGLSWLAPTDSGGTKFLLQLFNLSAANPRLLSLLDALIAALASAAFFYLAWALYYLFRRRHGMGFGDIALMAMSGAFLGLKLAILVLFFAPLLAAVWGIVWVLATARNPSRTASGDKAEDPSPADESVLHRELPFGVFLGGCSLLAIFFGEATWRWYFGFFR